MYFFAKHNGSLIMKHTRKNNKKVEILKPYENASVVQTSLFMSRTKVNLATSRWWFVDSKSSWINVNPTVLLKQRNMMHQGRITSLLCQKCATSICANVKGHMARKGTI